MCWKKKVIDWPHSKYVAFLEGINNYPNSSNNLNGCVPDILLAESKLYEFQIRKFIDSKVTRNTTKAQLEYIITNSNPGDTIFWQYSGHGSYVRDTNGDEADGVDETLYLYDGHLVDDDTNLILSKVPIGVTFIVILDSCFSGSATRNPCKSRFIEPKKPVKDHVRIRQAVSRGNNWIVMSACLENESAADACINGNWNGAFSYYLWNTFNHNLTYRQWFNNMRKYLPNSQFSQTPTLEGPDYLLDKLILT